MRRIQQYIYEVYKERSFSRAAQNLFIAQSSLSTMVIKQERELGIQIFDRSTSPISLTEAGEVYLQTVRRILEIEQELEAYLNDYNHLKTGHLVLGAPHFFSCYLLPPVIAEFHRQYPGIQIKLVEADSLRLFQLLGDGELDLMVDSAAFDPNLFQSYPLLEERILLAVPQSESVNETLKDCRLMPSDLVTNSHQQNATAPVQLNQFCKHSFLLLEKGHDMHARAMQLCREEGFEPRVYMKLNQLMTTYNLTGQQLGISFVSDTVVKLSGVKEHVCLYKLDGEKAVRQVYLAHKKGRYQSLPMRRFVELAQQAMR